MPLGRQTWILSGSLTSAQDSDARSGFIAGIIGWEEPSDAATVANYSVYVSDNPVGDWLGTLVPDGQAKYHPENLISAHLPQ